MHILTFRASGPYAIRVPGPYASCGPRARMKVAGLGPEFYTGPGPVCVASFVVVLPTQTIYTYSSDVKHAGHKMSRRVVRFLRDFRSLRTLTGHLKTPRCLQNTRVCIAV